MGDLVGILILIFAVYSAWAGRKKKTAKTALPQVPYTSAHAPLPDERADNDAQFAQEMQRIKQIAGEKQAVRKAGEAQASGGESSPEGVDPCHDGLLEMEAHDDARREMQPQVYSDAPAPLKREEGVDPCHDALYEPSRAEEADAYDLNEPEDGEEAAQELLRGVILAEILTRPSGGWRTQNR